MKLLKSFFYAFRGIAFCIRAERNFRIHITAIITVLIFSFLYGLPQAQYPPLILIFALVPALEAINTSIERAVDLESKESNPLAKAAKDSSAAAVLIASIGAVAMACVLFSDLEKLKGVLMLLQTYGGIAGLATYLTLAIIFVFAPRNTNQNDK